MEGLLLLRDSDVGGLACSAVFVGVPGGWPLLVLVLVPFLVLVLVRFLVLVLVPFLVLLVVY